jgi:hypothetical protein
MAFFSCYELVARLDSNQRPLGCRDGEPQSLPIFTNTLPVFATLINSPKQLQERPQSMKVLRILLQAPKSCIASLRQRIAPEQRYCGCENRPSVSASDDENSKNRFLNFSDRLRVNYNQVCMTALRYERTVTVTIQFDLRHDALKRKSSVAFLSGESKMRQVWQPNPLYR